MQQALKRWVVSVGLACLSVGAWAQPVVSNIRVETDAQRLKVTYDLAGTVDQDSVYLHVESRTRGLLKSKTVTGDVGRHLLPGTDKVIYWDYAMDGERISEEIRPIVGVVEVKKPYTGPPVGGGPVNALLSVLLPGLGNIMVQPNHHIGWRPLITAAYGGLLVYGLVQKSQSSKNFALYNDPALLKLEVAEPYYEKANAERKRYVLAIRTAAVVLLADVVYTFIKGTKNARQIRTFQRRITLNYSNNVPTIGMQFTF